MPEYESLLDEKEGLKEEVYNEIRKFFNKVDTVEQDEVGNFIIDDNADKEIIVRFQIDNLRITVSKISGEIFLQQIEEIE